MVSLSNHERTCAEFRSFLERVEMTFSRIALRCIWATPLFPFVVSSSNHERNQGFAYSSFNLLKANGA